MFDIKPEPNTHRLLMDAVDEARRIAMQFRYEMKTGTGVAYCFIADREYAQGAAESIFQALNCMQVDLFNIPIGKTEEIRKLGKNGAETPSDE